MRMPPRGLRMEDVKDVGDVCRQGCNRSTASSNGAENVLNVPNVLQVHDGPGTLPTDPCRPGLKPGASDKGLHGRGGQVRAIAEILAQGCLRLMRHEGEKP